MNGVGEGAFSNERSATPLNPAVRDIAGIVRAASGSAAAGRRGAGLPRRRLPRRDLGRERRLRASSTSRPAPTSCARCPPIRRCSRCRRTADATQQSRRGFDLRLMTSGAGASDAGPSTFRVTGCTGGTLHYVATADGAVARKRRRRRRRGRHAGRRRLHDRRLVARTRATRRCSSSTSRSPAPTRPRRRRRCSSPTRAAPSSTTTPAARALAGATVTLLDAAGNAIPRRRPAPVARDLGQPRDERRPRRLGLGRGAGHLPRERHEDELRHRRRARR